MAPDVTPSADEPAADADVPGTVSRRVLLGSGLLVLGAVGGAGVAFAVTDPPREVVPDPVPPADVLAAIGREDDLLAAYDAAIAAGGAPLLTALRADHASHREALVALLPAGVEASSAGPTSTTATPTPTTTADGAPGLAAAEQAAATAARTAALAGNGTASVLLACIAACEASHVAVLG